MLRSTTFKLLLPFTCSYPLLCSIASPSSAIAKEQQQSPYGPTPFSSKIAHKPQQQAGIELANNFAQKFAEHHKAKSEEDIKKERTLKEKAHFKDSTDHHDTIIISLANDEKATESLRRRLMFQSRYRGMAELDLILGAFAQEILPEASVKELVEYDQILRELDTDLFHWLVTIPGRKNDAGAGGSQSKVSHAKQTAQSILNGTSDYSDVDRKISGTTVTGSTPTVDDEFVEPKELLEAEWHRRDEVSENLRESSMWKKLTEFVDKNRNAIVNYR